jgi:hypothetical protein
VARGRRPGASRHATALGKQYRRRNKGVWTCAGSQAACPRHLSDVPTHQRTEGVPPPATGPDRLISIRVLEDRGLTYAQSQLRSGEEPADGGADDIESPVADGEVAGWWYASTTLPTVRVRLPEGKPVTEAPMYRASGAPRRCSSPCPEESLVDFSYRTSPAPPAVEKTTGRALAAGDSSFPQVVETSPPVWCCGPLGDRGATAAPPGRARDWKRCRWQTGEGGQALDICRLLRFACLKGGRRSVGYKR